MTRFLTICPMGVMEELYPGYLPSDEVIPDLDDDKLQPYLVSQMVAAMMDNNGDSGGETGERDMGDAIEFLVMALETAGRSNTPSWSRSRKTPMKLLQYTLDVHKNQGG